MKIKLLTILFLYLIPSMAVAFDSVITDTYILGNGDSKVTAEKMLLESMKQEAANQAGIYIQADKSLTTSGYKDSIRMISASIVKLEVLKEHQGTTKDGSFYLTITAKANIDDSELRNRIKAIQSDKDKDRLIKSLQKDQEKLRGKLNQLKLALNNKGLTRSKVSEIISEQSDLGEQMIANVNAVGQVFKRGSLLSMSRNAEDEDKAVKEGFKKQYLAFWKKQSKQLKASVHEIRRESPNKYKLTIKVEMNNFITKEMQDVVFPTYGGKYRGFQSLNKTGSVSAAFEPYYIEKLNAEQKKVILARLEYIFYHPVYLSVGIPSKKSKIHFFGRFEEAFMSDSPFKAWKKEPFSSFRDACYDIGYTKMIIGFRNKTHDDRIYRKNGRTNSFFFDIYLTQEQTESANKVTAVFVY